MMYRGYSRLKLLDGDQVVVNHFRDTLSTKNLALEYFDFAFAKSNCESLFFSLSTNIF